jgi:hypothetical protein
MLEYVQNITWQNLAKYTMKISEIDRRGFLRGLGAAGATAAGVGAQAKSKNTDDLGNFIKHQDDLKQFAHEVPSKTKAHQTPPLHVGKKIAEPTKAPKQDNVGNLTNKPLPKVDPVKAQQTPTQAKFSEPAGNEPFKELPLKTSWFNKGVFVPWENVNHYLKTKHKLDKNARMGLLANMDQESSFKLDAYNPNDRGGPSGGLFQWHDKASDPRQRRFTKMTKAVPDWQSNWKAQIDYALSEPESQNWLVANNDWGDPKDAAENATCTWVADFEKPADRKIEFRKRCALLPKYKTA